MSVLDPVGSIFFFLLHYFVSLYHSLGHCYNSINNLVKCNRKLGTKLTDGPLLVQISGLFNAQQFNTSLQHI